VVEDDSTVKEIFYSQESAKVMARFIVEIHQGTSNHGASFAQNYILQKGLKLAIWRGRIQGSWQGTGSATQQELLLTPRYLYHD
jgi:hypothetical protein